MDKVLRFVKVYPKSSSLLDQLFYHNIGKIFEDRINENIKNEIDKEIDKIVKNRI